MAFVPFDSSHLKPALEEFRELLRSSVGPSGCLCVIKSLGGSLTLTSSSSRILSNLLVQHPIIQFVLQSIRSQSERYGDGGLYCGILISNLVICLCDDIFPKHISRSVLSELACLVQSEMQNSTKLKVQIGLDSINHLLAVARSVLFSKCGPFVGRDKDSLEHANMQLTLLVRAFLQSEASIEKVLLSVHVRSSKQSLWDGILYQSTDNEHIVLHSEPWQSVSILLFSVMLTDKLDSKEKELSVIDSKLKGARQLEAAQVLIEKAVRCGIRIIACQKVVHPAFLLRLRREGVLVLQRLGRRVSAAIEILTGAIPISVLKLSDVDSLCELKGHVKSVKHVKDSGNDFVFLEGVSNSGICSLILTSRTQQSAEDLKVLCHQVLTALSQTLQCSTAFPGAGCTEMYLSCFLQNKVQSEMEMLGTDLGCSVSNVNRVVRWLQEGLLLAAGLDWRGGKLAVDSAYHHAWKSSDSKNSIVDCDRCNCGLVMASDVRKEKGDWSLVGSTCSEMFPSRFFNPLQTPGLSSSQSERSPIIDVYLSKINAFKVALDTCISLTNIGAMILKEDAHV